MSFENQLLDIIKAVMPEDAEICVVAGVCAFNVNVAWKLNDDPERPNKMSRSIAICVSEEAVDAFINASPAEQRAAFQHISAYLFAKLVQFEPHHNTPRQAVPPVEQWLISSSVVCGLSER